MKEKNMNTKSIIRSIIEMGVCAVIIYLVFTFVVIPVRIQGGSMENNLHDGNIAFINAIDSRNGNVDRFDVVVLYSSELNEKIIKRVIGLPGEHIIYKDDKLYVNGQFVEQNFFEKKFIEESKKQNNVSLFTNDFEVTVGNDEIFVLGDNRLRSTDSRVLGCFSFDDVLGKQGMILYPFSDIQWID